MPVTVAVGSPVPPRAREARAAAALVAVAPVAGAARRDERCRAPRRRVRLSHGVANARVLQISTIRVRGNQHLAQGEVLALLEGLQGQHILATDLDVWRQKLLVSPWIEQARAPARAALDGRSGDSRAQADGPRALGSTLYLVDEGGLVIDEYGPNYASSICRFSMASARARHGRPSVEPARAGLAARVIASLGARPDLLRRSRRST